jgi:sodium pump decarboxylase gamma subunit
VDKITFGLQLTVVGMGIVFIILVILSYFMDLLRKLFYKEEGPKKKEEVSAGPISPSEPKEAEDNYGLIAAISAAIAQEEGSGFRIACISRIHENRPLWSYASQVPNAKLRQIQKGRK